MARNGPFLLGQSCVERGTTQDIRLEVSQTYTGDPVAIPVRVIAAREPGPIMFITAAVHGNEINGTGIVHELMYESPLDLIAGTLLLLPVVNVFGFEQQNRYMPDRRDLNRNFPGSPNGSLTRRIAHVLFEQIVRQCDFGIDLHSAAVQRTNYPNVRGDLKYPGVRKLSKAFRSELIVNSNGPEGSLRREACAAGCPTIILEAGEPSKVEPSVQEFGVHGVRNVLIDLGMIEGKADPPAFQTRVNRTAWIRAQVGGILRFHVAPGDLVRQGQALATNVSVFGEQQNVLECPLDGIVLGMTTLPTVKPGEPICLIAVPRQSISSIENALAERTDRGLHDRVRRDLATSIAVTSVSNGSGGGSDR